MNLKRRVIIAIVVGITGGLVERAMINLFDRLDEAEFKKEIDKIRKEAEEAKNAKELMRVQNDVNKLSHSNLDDELTAEDKKFFMEAVESLIEDLSDENFATIHKALEEDKYSFTEFYNLVSQVSLLDKGEKEGKKFDVNINPYVDDSLLQKKMKHELRKLSNNDE